MAASRVVHVIDDDADVRQSLAFLLSTAGLAVRVHASAVAFLKVLSEIQEGGIVTDMRRPELDGPELQRAWEELKAGGPGTGLAGPGFPTTAGSYQPSHAGCGPGYGSPYGSSACLDAFVAKVDPTASGSQSLIYSTYLGGSGDDVGRAIPVDRCAIASITASARAPSSRRSRSYASSAVSDQASSSSS